MDGCMVVLLTEMKKDSRNVGIDWVDNIYIFIFISISYFSLGSLAKALIANWGLVNVPLPLPLPIPIPISVVGGLVLLYPPLPPPPRTPAIYSRLLFFYC